MPKICGYFQYGYVNYIINMPCKCIQSNSYILKNRNELRRDKLWITKKNIFYML